MAPGFPVSLTTSRRDIFDDDDISKFIDSDSSHVLHTNMRYSFTLSPVVVEVQSAEIFFNDSQLWVQEYSNDKGFIFDAGKCRFYMNPNADTNYRPFSDLWGYAQIHICLTLKDGTQQDYYSDFLTVSNDDISIEGMASYVYSSFPALLTKNGPLNSKVHAGMSKYSFDPLDTKISLIKKIVQVYDKHYDFFRENARVTTTQESRVDRLEKLQYASAESVQYAAQHPEELSQVMGGKGIRIGRSVYHPKHVMMSQNVLSHDTYENRAVLNFLPVLRDHLDELEKTLNNIQTSGSGHFVTFHEHLFSREYLNIRLPEIVMLRTHISVLIRRYSQAFGFKPERLTSTLHPTGIFRKVHPYREIYGYMLLWNSGVYNFESDKLLLYCIGSSRLYESFVLVSILEHVVGKGYQVEGSQFNYATTNRMYQNTPFSNTFVCTKGDKTLTIYYQPVVYATGAVVNGIELKRVDTKKSNQIYTPDYIFKYQDARKLNAQYIICDAKFSNLTTVHSDSFPEVMRKYNKGIKPIGNANISNCCLVYGKHKKDEDPDWITYGETEHRRSQQAKSPMPIAKIVPLGHSMIKGDPKLFVMSLDNMMGLGNSTNSL